MCRSSDRLGAARLAWICAPWTVALFSRRRPSPEIRPRQRLSSRIRNLRAVAGRPCLTWPWWSSPKTRPSVARAWATAVRAASRRVSASSRAAEIRVVPDARRSEGGRRAGAEMAQESITEMAQRQSHRAHNVADMAMNEVHDTEMFRSEHVPRLDWVKHAPEVYKVMIRLDTAASHGAEPTFLGRASRGADQPLRLLPGHAQQGRHDRRRVGGADRVSTARSLCRLTQSDRSNSPGAAGVRRTSQPHARPADALAQLSAVAVDEPSTRCGRPDSPGRAELGPKSRRSPRSSARLPSSRLQA
jgi:hypothetical protein